MTDQLSLLPMLDDAEHPTWLLNGKHGVQNDCGYNTETMTRADRLTREALGL